MHPLLRILLVLPVLAACGGDRPAPPQDEELRTLGPLRLGMQEEALRAAMHDARIDMFCAMERTALRFCERQNTGDPLQVAYGTVSGRATYLMREARAGWASDGVDAMVTRRESRFGPASTTTADAPGRISTFRYWYPRRGPYRALVCGKASLRLSACREFVVDDSPASVGALVMSRAMERWATYSSDDACPTWEEMMWGDCTPSDVSRVGTPLQPDQVFRIGHTTHGPPLAPSGAKLLLETGSGRYHYRIWQLPGGNLHGLVCWKGEGPDTCQEIVARYQPEAFLTMLTLNSR